MSNVNEPSRAENGLEEVVYRTLSRVSTTMGMQMERSDLDLQPLLSDDSDVDLAAAFQAGASQVGLAVKETELRDARGVFDLVNDGLPVIWIGAEDECLLMLRVVGRRLEVHTISRSDTQPATMTRGELKRRLTREGDKIRLLVAKEELECNSISSSPTHGDDHDHHHLSPTRRFLGLIRMDAGDIATIVLFAFVAGALGLATPLAVESLVNVVSWGIYLQPLFILSIMLLTCLGFSAALSILQTIVVEIVQRRQLVRIVSDLAHRFPRANRGHLEGQYPRELANRVFDIMTIQKATAILLVDGVSIVLTAFLGLLLLAFYHPFLLGFDIILLSSMVVLTWVLGRGGIRTAIRESITKYAIAHWLQDVLDSPQAFRVNGGEAMAIDRASRLATAYVDARKAQFRVVLRQVIFAVGLQVVASTALLGLGGWLVIQGELTLGQLVASELVVTVVLGAFSKAGKSLEKYYDLMAGTDKVGHLLDIPVEPHDEVGYEHSVPLSVKWDDVRLALGSSSITVPASEIEAGTTAAIFGAQDSDLVMDALAGLLEPKSGLIEAGGFVVSRLAVGCHQGQAIGYASGNEIFHGTVNDNIDLGRTCVGRGRVREVLQLVGLWDAVTRLPDSTNTRLQTYGYPLSGTQAAKLMIARALAGGPGVLLINGLLDVLPRDEREQLWKRLRTAEPACTIIIATRRKDLADSCDQQIFLGDSLP